MPYGGKFLIRRSVRIIPAHKKHRRSGRCPSGAAIYADEQKSLSRPIIGHTPRKLPPCGAISRFIAVFAAGFLSRADFLILQHDLRNVKRFFSVFYNFFGGFSVDWCCLFDRAATGRLQKRAYRWHALFPVIIISKRRPNRYRWCTSCRTQGTRPRCRTA